jgi:hypothetical protein
LIDNNGYVSTNVFINVLSGMSGSHKLEEPQLDYIKRNSSLKGKVNYGHVLKRLTLFKKEENKMVD